MSITLTFFFFFNDTATTEIYTLPLHDALPIFFGASYSSVWLTTNGNLNFLRPNSLAINGPIPSGGARELGRRKFRLPLDRKSTRLNSSHGYNLVCRLLLEKKKQLQRRARIVHS